MALTTNGFAAVLVQTVTFPFLQKRWGTMKVFRTTLLIWPAVFGLLPIVRWLAKERTEASGPDSGSRVAMIGLVAVLAIKSFGKISIVCLTLLVNSAAPSASTFGALNGLAQSCSELARTFAPFITGAIFSISIDKQYLNGNLIWLCGLSLSCFTLLFAQKIKVQPSQDQKKADVRRPLIV